MTSPLTSISVTDIDSIGGWAAGPPGIGPGGWGEAGRGGEGCDDSVVEVVIAGLGVPDLEDLEPVGGGSLEVDQQLTA